MALKKGADHAVVVDTSKVYTAPWVRLECRFGCRRYNTSLCCPPRSPPRRTIAFGDIMGTLSHLCEPERDSPRNCLKGDTPAPGPQDDAMYSGKISEAEALRWMDMLHGK